MLRFTLLACLTAFVPFVPFVATTPVFAHQDEAAPATGVEVGTLFGFGYYPDEKLTAIQAPSLLYVSWFPSERLALGPEFSLAGVSDDESSVMVLSLGVRGAFFLRSNAVSSPYLLVNGSLQTLSGDATDSDHNFGAGAGLGYQERVGSAFVLRAEGRYQRWFRDETNRGLLFSIGLGTRFGGR